MHRRRGMNASSCTRRSALALAMLPLFAPRTIAAPREHREFIDAAFRMREEAVRSGDQPFGAVVVAKDRRIVGFGPSRVVVRKDATAHAEREAIREAQARLGLDLRGCVLYSTSRPCSNCEAAAAQAKIARMFYGSEAADAGVPRG